MQTIEARLIRGSSYTYGGRVFRADAWVPVTAKERDHLLESAVDSVTVSGGGQGAEAEFRQKFEFRDSGINPSVDGEVEPKKTAPRARRRRKATRKRSRT